MIIEMPCITCPMSCHLQVTINEQKEVIVVTGNTCPRGIQYAHHELTCPKRMVTTTMRIKHALHPLLPVMTTKPVPKDQIFAIIKECRNQVVLAPIQQGEILLHNPLGLDVDIIATRSLNEVL